MRGRNDKRLIERFISWAIRHDLNQTEIGHAVRRSPNWASYLVRGEIRSLNFDTRNRIIAILKKDQG